MPKFAANLTMLFNELPFLDRFAAAKAAGFSGVEYLFPYEFEKAELREKLQQHGLTQVLHNLPAGQLGAPANGASPFCRIGWTNFATACARAIDYAKALDCRQLNCLVGVAPADADRFELNEVLRGQSAVRGGRPRARTHSSADRADQHPRHSRLLPEQDGASRSDHLRCRIGQSLYSI